MNDDTVPNTTRRRVVLRRRGTAGGSSGFSSGISTTSESLRDSDEDQDTDEVDDVIDPNLHENIRDRIRSGNLTPPSPAEIDRENPRGRLNQVAMAGSSSYAKEFRLQLLHRLLMRNIPLDQIATQLQVSISTVEKDRAELKKRLREAATQLNIDEMVGGQMAVYDEIAGMAMRVASGGATRDENGNHVAAVPTAMKLAAMRTALAANADRTRFLASAGVLDVLRFRRSEDGTNISDVALLMQRTAEMMESLNQEEGSTRAPPPSPGSKLGGFGPLTFDDLDASGSSAEVQEI